MKALTTVLCALALVGFSAASWAECSYGKYHTTMSPTPDEQKTITQLPLPKPQDGKLIVDVKQPETTETAN